jgi:mRNA-degrading endonuclease RelE of RelBE toxin-antitoxin system
MKIIYSKKAVKAIAHMDKITKQRIKLAIEKLPDGDTIAIEKIAPRGEAYKGV